jgi:hypothetical protein
VRGSDRRAVDLRTLNRVAPLRQASAMDSLPHPLAFLLQLVSGWVNRPPERVTSHGEAAALVVGEAHPSGACAARRIRFSSSR